MTTPVPPSTPDPGAALMDDWFQTVSYVNDYPNELPEVADPDDDE